MKKLILYSLIFSGTLLTTGCNEDWNTGVSSEGSFSPIVTLDTNTLTKKSRAQLEATITAEDLHLALTAANPKVAKREWESVSEFNTEEKFTIGGYTLEAYYGDKTKEGFELPYYYGATTFTIRENETTPVTLTASLGNAMITPTYSESFVNYFNNYSLEIKTIAGNSISYASNETRPVYVAPGSVQVIVHVVKPNGVAADYQAVTFAAEACHHYHINLEVNDGNVGNAFLNISFDDTLDQENILIDLSQDLENVPAPTVSTDGFTNGQTITVINGSGSDQSLKFTIMARGSLASVMLETKSVSLKEQGWPEKVDLMAVPTALQVTMTSMGFSESGLWKNPDKMAMIDLSNVISYIRYIEGIDNTSTFTLTVTDRLSQTAEAPVDLTVNVERLKLNLSNPAQLTYYEGEVTVDMEYNGQAVDQLVKIQYLNRNGVWTNLPATYTEKDAAAKTFTVEVSGLPTDDVYGERNVQLRAVAYDNKGKVLQTSEELAITRVAIPFTLSLNDLNAFSNHATGTVTHESEELSQFATHAKLMMSTDDGATFSEYNYTLEGDRVVINGLQPKTTYIAYLTDDGFNSRKSTFTTEEEIQLPNSGMDEWSSTKKGDYQYLWTVGGNAWNTLNDLTTSQSGSGSGNGANTKGCAYKSTSGTIPANSRSTKSTDSGGFLGTNSSGDGNTQGNANLHSDKQHSGSNAALIRTVGWGSGNTASASVSGQHFGTCNNKTPGELFLGTLDGTTPVYGYAFASRPSSLSFYYKYDVVKSGNGDYGKVEVKMYDAAGNEVLSKEQNLAEQANYTQVTIPFEYDGTFKVSKLSLRFISSANSDIYNSSSTNNWHCPGVKNVSGGEYVGSELYIDDITLNY